MNLEYIKLIISDLIFSFLISLPVLFISLKAYIIAGVIISVLIPLVSLISLAFLFKDG